MITINKITTGYGSAAESGKAVLDNISLSFAAGEFCSILGQNGAGKSTLLKAIIGYLSLWSGNIQIDKTPISAYSHKELAKKISIIPQEVQLYFDYTVYQIILMGRYPYLNFWQKYHPDDIEIVNSIIKEYELEKLRDKVYSELSGGEKQRVVIGRTMAQDTPIILMDEAFVHLDINHQLEIMSLLRQINKKRDKLIILVSHDINLCSDYTERIIMLKEGRVSFDGTPESIVRSDVLQQVYNTELNTIINPYTQRPNIIYPGK